jgi:hypothetical protein
MPEARGGVIGMGRVLLVKQIECKASDLLLKINLNRLWLTLDDIPWQRNGDF